MILVLCSPRSGSSFYAKCLQSEGLDVQHEKVGKDGTVSPYFFTYHPWYPYGHRHRNEQKKDYTFTDIRWLVRDPLKSITSLATLYGMQRGQKDMNWYNEIGVTSPDMSNLLAAMMIWSRTNASGFWQSNTIVKLEDVAEKYSHIAIPNKQFNPPTLTWKDLEMESEELADSIKHKAEVLGYESSD